MKKNWDALGLKDGTAGVEPRMMAGASPGQRRVYAIAYKKGRRLRATRLAAEEAHRRFRRAQAEQ